MARFAHNGNGNGWMVAFGVAGYAQLKLTKPLGVVVREQLRLFQSKLVGIVSQASLKSLKNKTWSSVSNST